jgi:hypothetical protein
MSAPDTRQPIFDPGMDVATLVFSHVQCVRTRHSLALVSKLWREASKPAAAYPLEFDWGAFADMSAWTNRNHVIVGLLDNDEALSLPYERVIRLLGEAAKYGSVYTAPSLVCDYAARRGSLRLLKWTRENNCVWECAHVPLRSLFRTIARSPVLARETGALGTGSRALGPPKKNTGTACSTRWTTSARAGRNTPRHTRSTSHEYKFHSSFKHVLHTYVPLSSVRNPPHSSPRTAPSPASSPTFCSLAT